MAYGIEAVLLLYNIINNNNNIMIIITCQSNKISVDLWKTAIKIMNSDNSLCNSRETMGIPKIPKISPSMYKPLQI